MATSHPPPLEIPRAASKCSNSATKAALPKATLLFFLLLLILVEPASPHGIVSEGLRRAGRRLLQAVANSPTPTGSIDLALSLCQTNVCEMQRPDGVCDRWSRSMHCPQKEYFRISGDPGSNDKAEMFLTLRSPWGVNCSLVRPAPPRPAAAELRALRAACRHLLPLARAPLASSVPPRARARADAVGAAAPQGRCVPSLGAAYDVHVAEGCIPERDYISEMQDTSARTSKQVKVYLRRSAEFFITVERRAGLAGAENCSYGLTTGSIEAEDDSASCFNFSRLSVAESLRVPLCRDVMPTYQGFEEPVSGAQTTFVAALVGVGILTLALLVLGAVLLRRLRRQQASKKALDAVDVGDDLDGLSRGGSGAAPAAPEVPLEPVEPEPEAAPAGSERSEALRRKYGLDKTRPPRGREAGRGAESDKDRARRAAVGRRLKELEAESGEEDEDGATAAATDVGWGPGQMPVDEQDVRRGARVNLVLSRHGSRDRRRPPAGANGGPASRAGSERSSGTPPSDEAKQRSSGGSGSGGEPRRGGGGAGTLWGRPERCSTRRGSRRGACRRRGGQPRRARGARRGRAGGARSRAGA